MIQCSCIYCRPHRNPDEELRRRERGSQEDPREYHRYLHGILRAGQLLPIEEYYRRELYPLGIDQRDFKLMIELLVQGSYWPTRTERNTIASLSLRGKTKDWVWMCRHHSLPIDDEELAACLLAVRGYTRAPSNARIYDRTFTVGHTIFSTEQLPGMSLQDTVMHPRNAWREEFADEQNHHFFGQPGIPTFWYQSAERDYDLPTPKTIAPQANATWAHGCITRGPDPCHVDLPHGFMMRWARRDMPDRQKFSVYEGRLYVGLDPETGRPYDYRENPDNY